MKITQLNKFNIKITCENKEIANKIISEESWNNHQINAFIPSNILTKSGVVYNIPSEVKIEELKEEIESEVEILEIKRMLKKNINFNNKEEESEKNKKLTSTEALIIKFRSQKLPEKISIYNTERKINILKPRIKFK